MNTRNVFGLDESGIEVEELAFSEVIEITGITPVDSVCDQYQRYYDYFDKRWEEDAQRLLDRDFA